MRASKRPRNNQPAKFDERREPRAQSIVQTQEFWQGPLPPPQTLGEFRALVPDAPERIVRQWELEAAHRREYEQKALSGQIWKDRLGQVGAIGFALGSLVLVGFCVVQDQPWVAGILGGGAIGSVVGAFLFDRRK